MASASLTDVFSRNSIEPETPGGCLRGNRSNVIFKEISGSPQVCGIGVV